MTFLYNPPTSLSATGLTPVSVTINWLPSTLVTNDISLLLHFDGTNGSTTITDSSLYHHSMTVTGAAALSTSSPKFGTACLSITSNVTPSTQRVSVPVVSGGELDILSGSTDFTVEGWVRVDSGAAAFNALDYGNDQSTFSLSSGFLISAAIGGLGLVNIGFNTSIVDSVTSAPWSSFSIINIPGTGFGSWVHVAVCRSAGQTLFFANGQPANAGASVPWHNYTFPSTSFVTFGRTAAASGGQSLGSVDEFQVLKGTAKYTSAFTPPAAPFADPGPPPGYTVFKDGGEIGQQLSPGVTQFTDTAVIQGATYSYTVAAQDGSDILISDFSSPLLVTIPFAVVPTYGKFVGAKVFTAVEISRVGDIIPRIWPTKKNNTVYG